MGRVRKAHRCAKPIQVGVDLTVTDRIIGHVINQSPVAMTDAAFLR